MPPPFQYGSSIMLCYKDGMQKQPSCKKEVRPSKVESYLKDECMVWLTTRGDI